MSSESNPTSEAVAKQAPTEQQETKPGVPKRFAPGQTVCNEKNEKGKLCNGHLKELNTQHPSELFLRGDDVLHRCQTCGALYMGPPMGHVRDPRESQPRNPRRLRSPHPPSSPPDPRRRLNTLRPSNPLNQTRLPRLIHLPQPTRTDRQRRRRPRRAKPLPRP